MLAEMCEGKEKISTTPCETSMHALFCDYIHCLFTPHRLQDRLFLPFLTDLNEIMDLWRRALTPPPNLHHLKPVACEVGHSSITAAGTYKGITERTLIKLTVRCRPPLFPHRLRRPQPPSRPRIIAAPAIPFSVMSFYAFNATGVRPSKLTEFVRWLNLGCLWFLFRYLSPG